MVRRSAIQHERDRVQLEIEKTEDALDKLVSFNYSLMQEMEMESQSDYSTDATGTDTDASSPTASSTLSEHLRSVFPTSPLTHNITNGPSSISSSYHEPSSPPSPVSSAPESYAASSESDGDAEYLDALKELRNDQVHSNYNSALAAEAHLEALHCEAADLARQRYLNRAHKYTPRPPGHGLGRCLDEDRQLNDEDFATELRMSRQAFNELYEAIKDHAVFKSRGKKPQTSPRIQLAVALWRFDGYGNRASAKRAVQWSGYSIGSVVKFTDRVILALESRVSIDKLSTHNRSVRAGRTLK
ncbi:BZ3500_MvSof-1268-A1-R1_Chr11-3g03542 [Microbotryum saponariae]|uniref:BZ3500_MvSof-1268-A1-R1_Chr11-3g03542 protein n=1 Tax=Microbotryum saponariae TaxID=289078 RepID=A0A2X0KMM2_9BASI|nr:BZ3500_MvSof-1268-A1-R1_Chr11-3g03542 [Microbotryum saponariae]SDA03551.1 BZ3501_MvSof-1269-A2-R1_Chr11g03119 [Microbotryum saponariae]